MPLHIHQNGQIPGVAKDAKEMEHLLIAGGNAKLCKHWNLIIPGTGKYTLTLWPYNSTWVYSHIQEKWVHVSTKRRAHNTLSSFVHKAQTGVNPELYLCCVCVCARMNTHTIYTHIHDIVFPHSVAHLHSGIIQSNQKKSKNTGTCNKIYESQNTTTRRIQTQIHIV